MQMSVDISALDGVQTMLRDIKNGYPKVVTTSINKTSKTTKVQVKKRLGQELNLKAARIEKDMSIIKANYQTMRGGVVARGEPVGLVNFGARQVQQGVSVQVLKSAARSVVRHAFIAPGRGGGNHVFWRQRPAGIPAPKRFAQGKKSKAAWPRFGDKYRYKVERLTGPRIEDILAEDTLLADELDKANKRFAENVSKQTDEVIRRFG